MRDDYNSPVGYFKIEQFDDSDKLVDTFEQKNLIMDMARPSMALLAGGVNDDTEISDPINRFYIGTQGHRVVGTVEKYPEPKLPNVTPAPGDSVDNYYDSTRTELFSERATVGGLYYRFDFAPDGAKDKTFNVYGKLYDKNSASPIKTDSGSATTSIHRVVVDRTVTYTVTIPKDSGNSQSGAILPFSEAALKCGPRIFSMKTFPARFKDTGVKLVITWSIIF